MIALYLVRIEVAPQESDCSVIGCVDAASVSGSVVGEETVLEAGIRPIVYFNNSTLRAFIFAKLTIVDSQMRRAGEGKKAGKREGNKVYI